MGVRPASSAYLVQSTANNASSRAKRSGSSHRGACPAAAYTLSRAPGITSRSVCCPRGSRAGRSAPTRAAFGPTDPPVPTCRHTSGGLRASPSTHGRDLEHLGDQHVGLGRSAPSSEEVSAIHPRAKSASIGSSRSATNAVTNSSSEASPTRVVGEASSRSPATRSGRPSADASSRHARTRVGGEHRPVDLKRVKDFDDLARKVAHQVARRRLVGIAVTTKRQRDAANRSGKPVEGGFVGPPRVRWARKHHDARPMSAPVDPTDRCSPDPRATCEPSATTSVYTQRAKRATRCECDGRRHRRDGVEIDTALDLELGLKVYGSAHEDLRAGRPAGVSASAIRYYERIGLLPAPIRTDAGYRSYDDSSVARLVFVTQAKRIGLTLEQISRAAPDLGRRQLRRRPTTRSRARRVQADRGPRADRGAAGVRRPTRPGPRLLA